MRTPTSNDSSSPSTSPRHQVFTMDRVKTMFSCLSSTEAESAAELCALYLSGTLSAELFAYDQPMGSGNSSSISSGSSSPFDGPLATSKSGSVPVSPTGRAGKRSSVKRRKNCKLNHKMDGNRNRAGEFVIVAVVLYPCPCF